MSLQTHFYANRAREARELQIIVKFEQLLMFIWRLLHMESNERPPQESRGDVTGGGAVRVWCFFLIFWNISVSYEGNW